MRALFLLLVLPMATLAPAEAQTGGIQIAPVMVTLSPERSITSLRLRNGRARPVAFEVDAYVWTQQNGRDVLTPTREVIVAPGVFEVAPAGEQVVRLGVRAPAQETERAYRLLLRELPSQRGEGSALGFALEMSLPVFVTPAGATASLQARSETHGDMRAIVLSNTGRAHLQLSSVQDVDAAGALDAPRYLLAGASAEVELPANVRAVRVRAAETTGSQTERIVNVDEPLRHASVR